MGRDNNCKGFTLIEVLLVLVLLMISVFFVAKLANNWLSEYQMNHYAYNFELKLREYQQYAIENKVEVHVRNSATNQVTFYTGSYHLGGNILEEYKPPSFIKKVNFYRSGLGINRFNFDAQGMIDTFTNIELFSEGGSYYYSLNLMRGRIIRNE